MNGRYRCFLPLGNKNSRLDVLQVAGYKSGYKVYGIRAFLSRINLLDSRLNPLLGHHLIPLNFFGLSGCLEQGRQTLDSRIDNFRVVQREVQAQRVVSRSVCEEGASWDEGDSDFLD